jgi:hypothetical protein
VRVLIVTALAGALLLAFAGLASASSRCSMGAGRYEDARSGNVVVWGNYRSVSGGMSCSSVRYVVNHWLRPWAADTLRIRTNFYDGYVRWRCYRTSHTRWTCWTPDDAGVFSFTAYRL